MPRANQGETKERTGATPDLSTLQSKLGPQQKDPYLPKLRDVDMKVQGSQSYLTSGKMSAKWRAATGTRALINLNHKQALKTVS